MSKRKKQPTTVIELLKEIKDAVGDRECIFRGEPSDQFEEITSSLFRKLEESVVLGEHMNSEQLEQIPRRYRQSALRDLQRIFANETISKEGSKRHGINVLAERQHYGGKTNLIDFSKDYLVALFFACNSGEYGNNDGRLIVFPKQDLEEISNNESGLLNKRYIVRPSPDNSRALIQCSVMLHEPKGYLRYDDERLEVIKVPFNLKSPMLKYLERHYGISDGSLFPKIQNDIEPQEATVLAMRHYTSATVKLREGRYEEALSDCSRALELKKPKDPVLYGTRALIYQYLGRYEEVLSDCTSAIELDDKEHGFYIIRARAYEYLGRYDEALRDCNYGIKLNSRNPRLYEIRSTIYEKAGFHDEASKDYDYSLKLDPCSEMLLECDSALLSDVNNPVLYKIRAQNYVKSRRYKLALEDCNRALELGCGDVRLYETRAHAYEKMGHYEEALLDCDRAIKLDDKNVELYMIRRRIYSGLERYREALLDCNRAIALDDKNARLYGVRALTYRELGRNKDELKDCDYAIELDGKDVLLRAIRAGIYRERGEFGKAKAGFAVALELAKNQGKTQFAKAIQRNLNELDDPN